MKHFMIGLVIGVTLMLAYGVAAAQSLIIHGLSYHSIGEYNNTNLGIGYVAENGIAGGYYRNSEKGDTFYVGYRDKLIDNRLSIVYAVGTGYDKTPVMPVIMLVGSIPIVQNISLNIGVAPIYDNDSSRFGVLAHSMIEYRF